jgi:hypothetical protein
LSAVLLAVVSVTTIPSFGVMAFFGPIRWWVGPYAHLVGPYLDGGSPY